MLRRIIPYSAIAVLLTAIVLVACQSQNGVEAGNPERGAELFITLPCSGCHGATAQGQFGPTLAGTSLTFQEVRQQVRNPRDKMPSFSREQVSEDDLHDIYAWLISLPTPQPTDSVPVAPATATIRARNRLFPELSATIIVSRVSVLDEVAMRIEGVILSVKEGERYSEVEVQMDDGVTSVVVTAIYDTAIARRQFPADPGSEVILYGVGADPIEGPEGQIPRIQIIYVVYK